MRAENVDRLKMTEVEEAVQVTREVSGRQTFQAVFTDTGRNTTRIEISGRETTPPARVRQFVEDCAST